MWFSVPSETRFVSGVAVTAVVAEHERRYAALVPGRPRPHSVNLTFEGRTLR